MYHKPHQGAEVALGLRSSASVFSNIFLSRTMNAIAMNVITTNVMAMNAMVMNATATNVIIRM